MTRRHLGFACEEGTLAATLDEGTHPVGLLLVSGGNEIRSGAFSGQARLAGQIAAEGFPVFRYDRRGVGDSSGTNRGYRESRADIVAAMAAFRAQAPTMRRVVGFGNCDAASALMLHGGAGCDALVLSNPWTFEAEQDDSLPAEAIRQRYAAKLRNPREVMRLLRGGVDLGKLMRGLRGAVAPAPAPTSLANAMQAGLAGFAGPVAILLAGRDRTAQAFRSCWPADDPRLMLREGADHAFSAPEDSAWLLAEILAALQQQALFFETLPHEQALLQEQAGQLDMR